MTFLPIVDRELRSAARRKSTFRIRSWTAVLAMLTSLISLLFIWAGSGGASSGDPLFKVLTGYAFGLCLLAGLFLTADSLSEEKREGTLGLLFLTDLKGYDVVLGKFFGIALNAFYGLLALLPITALPLLLGGVTGGEFWRTAIALVNTLFFSLAVGICVSALTRDSRKAMGQTLLALLLIIGGLPALTQLIPVLGLSPRWSCLAWASPVYAFGFASEGTYASTPVSFWAALGVSHAVGWLAVGLSSLLLPKLWQERANLPARGSVVNRFLRLGKGDAVAREKTRRRLLPINPVLWLLAHEPSLRWLVWGLVGVWGILVISLSLLMPDTNSLWVLGGAHVGGFVLKMLIAIQACRFFVDARRSGSLELLLCTPLRNGEILSGQWLALKRIFLWPLIVFLLVNFVPFGFKIVTSLSGAGPQDILTACLSAGGGLFWLAWFMVRFTADVFAVVWFGMWLALTLKKPGLAPALTILLVLIAPLVLWCGAVLADVFFILWGAIRLQQDLRWIIAQQYQRGVATGVVHAPLGHAASPPIIVR